MRMLVIQLSGVKSRSHGSTKLKRLRRRRSVVEHVTSKLKITSGSLGKDSYNRMALKAATRLAPDDAQIEFFDIEGIPLFNHDMEQNPAQRVSKFKKRIREADVILIVTPEHNYSTSTIRSCALCTSYGTAHS